MSNEQITAEQLVAEAVALFDELRERVARALHDSDPVTSPRTREDWDIHRAWYYSQADAVLRVVAEHLGAVMSERFDRDATRHLPTCPECAEVVHDADCRLVGDGRPVTK